MAEKFTHTPHSLFIISLDGHVGQLHHIAIVNSAAVSMDVRLSPLCIGLESLDFHTGGLVKFSAQLRVFPFADILTNVSF